MHMFYLFQSVTEDPKDILQEIWIPDLEIWRRGSRMASALAS